MAVVTFELLVVTFELLVVVLTGTLLQGPIPEWDVIDGNQLLNFYEEGQLSGPQSLTSTDDISDSDDAFPDVEGAATSENYNPLADHVFQVQFEDSPPRSLGRGTTSEFEASPPKDWDSFGGGDFVDVPPRSLDSGTNNAFVDSSSNDWASADDDDEDNDDFVAPPPRSWASSTIPSFSGLTVVCCKVGFAITLTGSLSEVKILGPMEMLSVMDAPESCGYGVNALKNTFTVPFTGCHVKHTDGYSLQLLFADDFGQTQFATAFCKETLQLRHSFSSQPKICHTPAPVTPALNCAVASGERVTCGASGLSSSDCRKMGCCVDYHVCYYPLDECTGDKYFVFAIRSNSVSTTLDPTNLVIPGNPSCTPAIMNAEVAIFKFRVTECGTRSYNVGETTVYLAEVQTVVKALNLKYGVIIRSDPIRFMIECRYSKTGPAQQSFASAGYIVVTPSSSLPTYVTATGLYSVELRIAKDVTYSSYFASTSLPLRLLLGKPVYLELYLKSPKPDAVIIVNYCVAYPRSARNALVLVYEGCANPFDSNVSILKVSGSTTNRNRRRFMVLAFQFMNQNTNQFLDEEIYFMCSTEVCRTAEKTCAERCFDGKAP
ncbi:zona pellucida sperm-binding protein 4-like [Anoplopoma fimbria]|uniref:zona pellucida sperm-binding protein 4-like n=1 Tax=Anoplopoma fimbria TaxID=229290 RepID=UPI0023ED608F|nr:zona pellucida sperm-binding protein 4-like [Anoplopoma fimbria]